MKKVLSIVLAVTMLLAAAPMAFAEETQESSAVVISATEETVIQAEDYPVFERTYTESGEVNTVEVGVQTNTLPNGTEVTYTKSRGLGACTAVSTIELTVEKTSDYTLEIVSAEAGWLSKVKVVIDGHRARPYQGVSADTKLEDESIAYYFGESDFPGRKNYAIASLTEGSHTLELMYDLEDSANSGVAFATDYIKFTPKAADIPVAEFTADGCLIEMENYTDAAFVGDTMKYPATIRENEFASGGNTFRITDCSIGCEVQVKIPVNVEKTGWYQVETVSSAWNNGSYISPSYLETEKRGQFMYNNKDYFVESLAALDEEGKPTYFDKNYPAEKFVGATYLEAGAQTITIRLLQRVYDTKTCYVGDYIKFTAMDTEITPAVISKNGESTIEFEDYQHCATTKMNLYTEEKAPGNQASGGAFLQVDTADRTADLYIDIPVDVERAGFYDVCAITTKLCVSEIGVNGKTAPVTGGEMLGEKLEDGTFTYFSMKHYGAFPLYTRVFLPEGNNTLTIRVLRRTLIEAGQEVHDVAGAFDCMTVTPVAMPEFTVAANGTTTKQMSEYIDYSLVDNMAAVQGKVVSHEKGDFLALKEKDASDGIYIYVPAVVEKSGWYCLDSVMSLHTSAWVSAVSISIDEKEVLNNELTYSVEDLSLAEDGETFDYETKDYPMHRFQNVCYVEAGEHMIVVYAQKRSKFVANDQAQVENAANGIFRTCFNIRDISLTAVEDSAVSELGAVSVTAYTNATAEDTVLVALYSGNQMIAIGNGTVANGICTANIACEDVPDTVKVFVISAMDTLKPKATVKEIEVK